MHSFVLLVFCAFAASTSAASFKVGDASYELIPEQKLTREAGLQVCVDKGYDGLAMVSEEQLDGFSAALVESASSFGLKGTQEYYTGGYTVLSANRWVQDFSIINEEKAADTTNNCIIATNWPRAGKTTVFTLGVKPCAQSRYPVCGTQPKNCPEQRAAFAAGDITLKVELQFDEKCRFNKRQCGEGMCVCVNPKTGEQKHAITFPDSVEYNCEKKPKACIKALAKQAESSAESDYVPQCDAKGRYLKMQCNSSGSECWCVKKRGKEIKGSRTSGKADC